MRDVILQATLRRPGEWQDVQDGSRLARPITVLKTRASHHEPVAHRYEISREGLVLGDEITLER